MSSGWVTNFPPRMYAVKWSDAFRSTNQPDTDLRKAMKGIQDAVAE